MKTLFKIFLLVAVVSITSSVMFGSNIPKTTKHSINSHSFKVIAVVTLTSDSICQANEIVYSLPGNKTQVLKLHIYPDALYSQFVFSIRQQKYSIPIDKKTAYFSPHIRWLLNQNKINYNELKC